MKIVIQRVSRASVTIDCKVKSAIGRGFLVLLGIFLTRFLIEFIKTEQESFEVGWALDMGQWLSIPFILLGIYMIYRGYSRPEVTVQSSPAATKNPAAKSAAAKPEKKHKR